MGALSLARKAHKIYNSWKFGGGIAQLIKNINRVIYCCDIAYQVDIPVSTKLPHQSMGVVMHPKTVIGENCTIISALDIWRNSWRGRNGWGTNTRE